ncbi:MAG: NusA-like transcription termination signal-binding factor [archaeon]|nr:NusA-like transcription termination signal-binding factor [archaeon]
MARLKLDQDALGLSSLLERIAHVQVKDCFQDEDTVYYIVETGQVGKAIGKKAENIHRIQEDLGKRVKVIEFKERVEDFVKSIAYPLEIEEVVLNDEGFVEIRDSRKKAKSLLIGRGGKNLQLINRAVRRFFNVEVKVIQ